jgi:8-oxo-dGTP pyrophosphatase MutT (NUDIX family)
MEHVVSEKPLPNKFGIPLRFIDQITNETPVNPDMWQITGIDTTNKTPPTHADFSHGIVTMDDPKRGVCVILNTDDGSDKGSYFNLIGGEAEHIEFPEQTFRREMLEETGVAPKADAIRYIGLIVSDDVPSTPLFGYHIQPEELHNIQPITGSKELALVPMSTLRATLPNLPWKSLGY